MAIASSRVLTLTRLDPCLIRLIVTQEAMGAFTEFGQARPELFALEYTNKTISRVREGFEKSSARVRVGLSIDPATVPRPPSLSLDLL